MMKCCLFQNGKRQYLALEKATIPVFDAAYLFGDGVYEVIAVVDGKFLDLDLHLKRLQASLKTILIPEPLSMEKLAKELAALLKENKVDEKNNGFIYLQVTRGSYKHRDFMIFAETKPALFAYYHEQALFPQQADEGETSMIFPDIRWALKHVKTTQLMVGRLAKRIASENSATEPIYINPQGIIPEGGSSNIFIIKDNELITHPADSAILWGITRQRVIELAKNNGLKVKEQKFALEEMLNADEVFRTSTTMGIRGIGQIVITSNHQEIFSHATPESIWQPSNLGKHKIGGGKCGKITRELAAKYAEYAKILSKNEEARKTAWT